MKIALSSYSSFSHGLCVSASTCAAIVFMIAVPTIASAQSVDEPLDATTLIALTNSDRETHNASPLVRDTLLDTAAQKKADDMMARGYFAHYGPNGQTPWYWFTSLGYYYTLAAENLAMDFNSPQSIEQAWMLSPKHRENILNPAYTRVGIGIAHGLYKGSQTTFVVQFFSRPVSFAARQSSSALKRRGLVQSSPFVFVTRNS